MYNTAQVRDAGEHVHSKTRMNPELLRELDELSLAAEFSSRPYALTFQLVAFSAKPEFGKFASPSWCRNLLGITARVGEREELAV